MSTSYAIAIFTPIIILCSVIGNVLTITAVVKTRGLRSRYAVRLITSLACCDLSFSLLSCPVNFVTTVIELQEWDSPLCTINGFLGVLFCVTSLLTLTIVSFDRYVAIVTPFRYHTWMTSCRVKIIIVSKWTLAAVVAAVPLSGWGKYVFYPQKGFCFVDYHKDFGIFIFIGVWFNIGFGVIAFTYYHIFKEARRQKKQIQSLNVANSLGPEDSIPENSAVNSVAEYSNQNPEIKTERNQHRKNLKRIKHENKAAMTIFAIIAGFLGCWMPFVVVNFVAAIVKYDIPISIDAISTLLVGIGSCVNPLFYAWLDSSFRAAFKRLLIPIFGTRIGSATTTATHLSGAHL